MHATIGTGAFSVAIREQPEREAPGEVVGRDRHVARVGPGSRPRAPQEITADAPLVRDELDAEVATERDEIGGCFDPTSRRDQEVTLWCRRKLGSVPIVVGRRASLRGRGCHRDRIAHA